MTLTCSSHRTRNRRIRITDSFLAQLIVSRPRRRWTCGRSIHDHRIGLALHKLDRMMDGDLDEVIDALTADDQARRLAEMT